MFGVALALVFLDQASKAAARGCLVPGQPVPVLGKRLFRLTLVENPGVAFGLRLAHPTLLLIVGLVATVVLSVMLVQLARKGSFLRFPIVLFLAGALGNSIDRIVFGRVTDFLDFDFPDFIMQRWPVFNVADSCVTIGIVLLFILMLFSTQQSSRQSSESITQSS